MSVMAIARIRPFMIPPSLLRTGLSKSCTTSATMVGLEGEAAEENVQE
jgi:hypothetical protein